MTEQNQESESSSDSSKRNWTLQVVTPIVSVGLSIAASWWIASYTIERQLLDATEQGQAVFESVGLRYFAAFYGLYRQGGDGEPFTFKEEDDPAWGFYRGILDDIQEDLRWIRTNPVYGRIQRESPLIPFAQNAIAREITANQSGNRPDATLAIMCGLFVSSDLLRSGEDEIKADSLSSLRAETVEFAVRLCRHVGNV